jgi:hypothetical protein
LVFALSPHLRYNVGIRCKLKESVLNSSMKKKKKGDFKKKEKEEKNKHTNKPKMSITSIRDSTLSRFEFLMHSKTETMLSCAMISNS